MWRLCRPILPAEQLQVDLSRRADVQIRLHQAGIFHEMEECRKLGAGFAVQLHHMPDQFGAERGRDLLSPIVGMGQILVLVVLTHHRAYFSIQATDACRRVVSRTRMSMRISGGTNVTDGIGRGAG
jgi:hypothetical protein